MTTPASLSSNLIDRHHIGYDATLLALRKKYYGDSESFQVDGITEFFTVSESERGTKYRCLTHPSSCFSPSLSGTFNWGKERWQALSSFLRKQRNWDVCRFNLVSETDLLGLKDLARRSGWRSCVTPGYFWVVSGTHTWQSYQASRRSSFNRNQRRCLKLMEKEGFRFTTKLEVDQIFRVFEARTDVKGSDDYSVTGKFRSFVTELREQYLREGRWFEYGVETPEGKLLAFVLCFRDDDGVFYAFQTGYDPAYRQLRLGAITFERVIEDALARGVKYISFMGNSEYFAQFTQEKYHFHVVDFFAPTVKGYFIDFRRRLGRFVSYVKRLAQPAPAAAAEASSEVV